MFSNVRMHIYLRIFLEIVYLTLRSFANFAQTAAKSFIAKNIFGTDSLYGNERGNGNLKIMKKKKFSFERKLSLSNKPFQLLQFLMEIVLKQADIVFHLQ